MVDLELLKIVYEDLCYLRDEWNDRIEPAAIRITGSLLRRLLVDDKLQKAWNEINSKTQPPNFRIVYVDTTAGNFTSDEIEFILSGSAEYNEASAENIMLIKGNRKLLKTPIVTVPLKKFSKATCVQIKHIKINNQELIRYVCNKLGGVHYDYERKNKAIENKFKYLDYLLKKQTWAGIDILGLDPVRFQFLSIGQIISRSSDIRKFISKLKNTLILKK